jgi:hypothetical protein
VFVIYKGKNYFLKCFLVGLIFERIVFFFFKKKKKLFIYFLD